MEEKGAEQPEAPTNLLDINIEEPRYDQDTYIGRARHFFIITNPLNLFASAKLLDNSKCIVLKHRNGEQLPKCVTEEQLWRAKALYDSAYHPDSGEKMILIGRMSAQVPMNIMITAGLMTFYKSTPGVIFWQWFNQSFNAIVNYTNRSGDNQISEKQLITSYVCATTGAVLTALTLNRLVKNAPPLMGRFVPFISIAAANCINIPLMRVQELKAGTLVTDQFHHKIGYSKIAAQQAISQVIFSRVSMAIPAMCKYATWYIWLCLPVFPPIVMNHLERQGTFCRYPWSALPIQIALQSVFTIIATPLACALFKQRAEMRVVDMEPELRETLSRQYRGKPPYVVFYNKGL